MQGDFLNSPSSKQGHRQMRSKEGRGKSIYYMPMTEGMLGRDPHCQSPAKDRQDGRYRDEAEKRPRRMTKTFQNCGSGSLPLRKNVDKRVDYDCWEASDRRKDDR